jgi:hypothetical protein
MAAPTPADLASLLQQDVDTATATLVLAKMTALFEARSRSHWGSALAVTWTKAFSGQPEIIIPYTPVVAVSQVRINGVALTTSGYTIIEQSLYRRIGWGRWSAFPPDQIDVDLTYGYPTMTDDVAAAILESAAAAYSNPDLSTTSEQIDDYQVRRAPGVGGMALTASAAALADWYAGALVG